MSLKTVVTNQFIEQFGGPPSIVTSSPGRVNLIGEHTDYNDGFVLPMAINYATWLAARPRSDSKLILHSLDFKESLEFDLTGFNKSGTRWGEYIKGVAWALIQAGFQLSGWEGVFSGNIPIGAGLSSSAALELAAAMAFSAVSGFEWEPTKMAQISQIAENQWVGVNCGIMDQMISARGRKDYALKIDCRSLRTELVPLPENITIVILDTNTRRGLVDSAYNERREQCESAANFFGVQALRDINLDQLLAAERDLDPTLFKRARHIVSENERVLDSVEALRLGDIRKFGMLMNASHLSMRDDFEISREEMDQIVEIAQAQPGCLGARMTGGGFGGCAVALVENERVMAFISYVSAAYKKISGLDSKAYESHASTGTSVEIFQG